ncbi:MAG: PilN domain-containing protein [Rhizomicrobium sp.]
MDGAEPGPSEWIYRLRAGWRWWLDELASLVPRRLRDAFETGRDAILIEVRPAELIVARRTTAFETMIARIPRDAFAARTLRLSTPRATGLAAWLADPVILQLPAEDALVRPLRLPRGAARNLDDILRHEVVRQSPIGTEDIYYDYRVANTDRDGLDVALRIIRREPVDDAVALCREAGIALSAVAFDGDARKADGGTFPADPAAAQRLRWAPRIVPMLAGLVLLLAAGMVASLYLRGEAVAADLSDRVDAARARAMTVERLQHRLDAANRRAVFLAQQKRNPAAIAVLARVARLLPDDTWLYEFELNGDEVRLHGFSPEAASLIALFDAAAFFSDAQFRSPLMQGPSPGLQRFDLSVRLKKGAT